MRTYVTRRFTGEHVPAKNCSRCANFGRVIAREYGCVLHACKVRGQVPLWTNNIALLNVDCDAYTDGRQPQQLEFEF